MFNIIFYKERNIQYIYNLYNHQQEVHIGLLTTEMCLISQEDLTLAHIKYLIHIIRSLYREFFNYT
jgi:hypothetical protein